MIKTDMIHRALPVAVALLLLHVGPSLVFAKGEPISMSVVLVNPSDEETQTVTVNRDLPIEVTPKDIVDDGGLDVVFDETRSMYYLYKESVVLQPSETKVFEVKLQDIWMIPQGQLVSLRGRAESAIGELNGSQYYDTAQRLGEAITKALDAVDVSQSNEAASRRDHITVYRNNLRIVEQVKGDIDKLEKQAEIARAEAKVESKPEKPKPPAEKKKEASPEVKTEKPKEGFFDNIKKLFK